MSMDFWLSLFPDSKPIDSDQIKLEKHVQNLSKPIRILADYYNASCRFLAGKSSSNSAKEKVPIINCSIPLCFTSHQLGDFFRSALFTSQCQTPI